jgi:hypothetical protein
VNGQVISNFSLINVADGSTVSLGYFDSYPGVVIIFTSNQCPYDVYYQDRIAALAAKSKLPVVLINSLTDEKESAEEMKEFAGQKGVKSWYLADKEQTVLRMFEAQKTPESFVLKNTDGKFSVVYRGAIDDNPQSATHVNHSYLNEAIDKLLLGQQIETPNVRPVGCSIRRN